MWLCVLPLTHRPRWYLHVERAQHLRCHEEEEPGPSVTGCQVVGYVHPEGGSGKVELVALFAQQAEC